MNMNIELLGIFWLYFLKKSEAPKELPLREGP